MKTALAGNPSVSFQSPGGITYADIDRQSASQTYYAKALGQLSLAETAMLAGLPKAPSLYNPISNPTRAKQRQQYVLRRMTELGRLVRLVDRASATMVHVEADRITPMAVPLMVIVGREALPPGAEADASLLIEAEALADEAMRA